MNIGIMFKLAQLGVLQHRTIDLEQETEQPIPHYRRNMTGKPNTRNDDVDYLTRLLLREYPIDKDDMSVDKTYSNEIINA